MPESVRDRFSTKHEHVFLFSKKPSYYFDLDAVREDAAPASVERSKYAAAKVRAGSGPAVPGEKREQFTAWDGANLIEKGKNPGDVWTIATKPFSGAHFA